MTPAALDDVELDERRDPILPSSFAIGAAAAAATGAAARAAGPRARTVGGRPGRRWTLSVERVIDSFVP